MIHIFFTKSSRSKLDDFKVSLEKVLVLLQNEDMAFAKKDIVQYSLDSDNKSKLLFNTKIAPIEGSVILINDLLKVVSDSSQKPFSILDSLAQPGKKVKILKSQLISVLSGVNECAVYFHENGLRRHSEFKNWIEDTEELKNVKFYYRTNKNQGAVIQSYKHEMTPNLSPFYDLMKLLSKDDLSKASFEKGLFQIKEDCYGDPVEQDKTSVRLRQIRLINKIIGGVTKLNIQEKELLNGVDILDTLDSLKSRNEVLGRLKKKFEL